MKVDPGSRLQQIDPRWRLSPPHDLVRARGGQGVSDWPRCTKAIEREACLAQIVAVRVEQYVQIYRCATPIVNGDCVARERPPCGPTRSEGRSEQVTCRFASGQGVEDQVTCPQRPVSALRVATSLCPFEQGSSLDALGKKSHLRKALLGRDSELPERLRPPDEVPFASLELLAGVVVGRDGTVEVVENRPEGQLVQLIRPAWEAVLREFQRDPSARFSLSPRRFEELVAASYEEEGFDEVVLTPRSGDFGRDIIAMKPDFRGRVLSNRSRPRRTGTGSPQATCEGSSVFCKWTTRRPRGSLRPALRSHRVFGQTRSSRR